MDQYVTRLRHLGKNCEFDKYFLDEAIKDQLIEHCSSTILRRRLLHEKSLASLSSLLDMARSMESANFQAANFEETSPQDHSAHAQQVVKPAEEDEQANFTSAGDDSAPTVDRQLTTNLEHQENTNLWSPRTVGHQLKNPVQIP